MLLGTENIGRNHNSKTGPQILTFRYSLEKKIKEANGHMNLRPFPDNFANEHLLIFMSRNTYFGMC